MSISPEPAVDGPGPARATARRLAVLLGCALAWALFLHGEELFRDAVYDDSGYYYSLYGMAEPSAFSKDLLVQAYRSGDGGAGFAWKWPINSFSLRTEAPFLGRLPLRKVLLWKSVIFQVLAGIPLFLLGASYYGAGGGYFFAAVFYAYFSTMDVFFGGLPRGENVCILGLALYALRKRSAAGLLAYAALTYFFYPAALPLALAVLGLFLFRTAPRGTRTRALAVFGAAAAGLLGYFLLSRPDLPWMLRTGFAWKSSFNVASAPELLRQVLAFNEHGPAYNVLTLLLLAATAWLLARRERGRGLPAELPLFGAALAAAYLAALAAGGGGFASRQLIHGLPLLLSVSFCYLFYGASWASPALSGALAGTLLLSAGLAQTFNSALDESPKDYLYRLSALPGDALILSHPRTARLVGLYSGKAVYSQDQWESLLCAFDYRAACAEAARRRLLALDAFYTRDGAAAAAAVGKSGATHVLVDVRLYDPGLMSGLLGSGRDSAYGAKALAAAGKPALERAAVEGGEKLGGSYYLLTAEAAERLLSEKRVDSRQH